MSSNSLPTGKAPFRYTVKVTEHYDGLPSKTYLSEPLDTATYDVDRIKHPFAGLPVPDDECGWIGKLTFTWGYFELEMNRLISALERYSGVAPASLQTAFKRRKERCRDLSAFVFKKNSSIHKILADILADSADLHWRRNVIVHGTCGLTMEAIGPENGRVWIDYRMIFTGEMEGKKRQLKYARGDLEKLYYKIGHLTGRMVQFIDPHDEFPQLSFADRAQRLAFLHATQLRPSIPTEP